MPSLSGSSVREILAFEVMSSTEWATPGLAPFVPNAFVDISGYLPKKLEALAAYELECAQRLTRGVLCISKRLRGIAGTAWALKRRRGLRW